MPLTLSSDLRPPPPGRADAAVRRRRTAWLAGSIVLHVAAIAAVLAVRRPEPNQPVAPSYDLMFDDGGASTPSTSEQAGPDATPPDAPGAPAPDVPATPPTQTAMAPPTPDAVPATPDPAPIPAPSPDAAPPPSAVPEPDPAPVQEAMAPPVETPPAPPPATAPPLPDPAPPAAAPDPAPPAPTPPVQEAMASPDPVPVEVVPVPPAPAQPAPPAVRLAQPDPLPTPPRSQDLVPDLAIPAPPPPLPPIPQPRRPAPAPPRQAFGSLGAPMDLNFGPAASRAPAPRPPGSRGIDFSLGSAKPGPNRSEAFFDIRAKNIGNDWAQSLAAYWRSHRFYPTQAAEAGEDGTVQVSLVVNRLGRVQSVQVVSRSGSTWLDMAAVSVWRNAQLPPLPAENQDATITIPLTINYLLIR